MYLKLPSKNVELSFASVNRLPNEQGNMSVNLELKSVSEEMPNAIEDLVICGKADNVLLSLPGEWTISSYNQNISADNEVINTYVTYVQK